MGKDGNKEKRIIKSRMDDSHMEFGGWILGEIWAKRLVYGPECWRRNKKKVSIVNLYKSWQRSVHTPSRTQTI